MSIFHEEQVVFTADEPYLVHHPTKAFQEMFWRNIEGKTGSYGGLLVISLRSPKFYAETEASPAIPIRAGSYAI